MYKLKRLSALVLSAALMLGLFTGCHKDAGNEAKTSPADKTSTSTSTAEKTDKSTTNKDNAANTKDENSKEEDLRVFLDSAGRSVKLPKKLTKVAPSGPLAQVMLYTAFPDKLAGVGRPFSERQKKYVPEKYHNLPAFGQFYGKKAHINKEALLSNHPDCIIDIGEKKKSIVEDMDQLQADLKIPTVFIEAHLDTIDQAYKKLAELFGEDGNALAQAEFCKKVLDKAATVRKSLKPEQKVKVYWAMGDKGLNTNAEKSFQSEVLQLVGADNVAKVKAVSRGGGSVVSMEDLLKWQPEVIILDRPELKLDADPAWKNLLEVSKARFISPPSEPFGALANPPSVNRILGIIYLGQKLYPDLYNVDLKATVQQFYKLFYHYELSDEEYHKLIPDEK